MRADGVTPARVEVTKHEDLDAVPPALRFRVELSGARVLPEELLLFSGELSTYYRSSVVSRELAETLLERRVPMLVWQTSPGELFAQPSRVLDVDTTYSLAALGVGVLAQITVRASTLPLLRRQWPPTAMAGGAEGGLYCADRPLTLGASELSLAPGGTRAELAPFGLSSECAVLTVAQPTPVSVLDPEPGNVLIDPAPLVQVSLPTSGSDSCATGCSIAGPGCLCPQDDRAQVIGPEGSVYWVLRVGTQLLQQETHAASGFVIPGLAPATPQTIHGMWFDVRGRQSPFEVSFVTGLAIPHLSINEVYADPNGPEPAQEWVELVNDGTVPTNLAGYVLEDAGGVTVLPDVELPPSGFAVVVNAAYQEDPDFDPLPDPYARLVRVERLGKGGLSNAGELMRLRNPLGDLVSRFPSLPAPKPGISVARRTPWAVDDDADSFALHGPPGASPGLPNQFATADSD